MRLVQTKHLFLTTRNRHQGSIYDSKYLVPAGQLVCHPHHMFRICLTRCSFFNDILNINSINNQIAFTDTATGQTTIVTLADGNYPFSGSTSSLGRSIASQYLDSEGAEKVAISYIMATNKMTFQFQTPHTISFPNGSEMWRILGFNNNSPKQTQQNTVKSDKPVRGRVYDRLLIKLKGMNPTSFALTNHLSQNLQLANILCAITITAPPYTFFNYINQSAEEMAMFVSEKVISAIRLEILDGTTGLAATHLPSDIDFVLRVDTFDTQPDTTSAKLDKLIEYMRLMFLSNNITDKGAEGELVDQEMTYAQEEADNAEG